MKKPVPLKTKKPSPLSPQQTAAVADAVNEAYHRGVRDAGDVMLSAYVRGMGDAADSCERLQKVIVQDLIVKLQRGKP